MSTLTTSELGSQIPSDIDLDKKRLDELIKFRESEDGQKLVGWCRNAYTKCRDSRREIENRWIENLAAYNRKSKSQMQSKNAQRGTKKLAVNRIRAVVRTELSKLTSQTPTVVVAPATGELEDMMAAQAGEQVVQSYMAREEVTSALLSTAFWQSISGNGFTKVYYDPSKIDPMQVQPELSADLYSDESISTQMAQGDIMVEAVTPFHVLVPHLQEEALEHQPYVIHLNVMSVDQVKFRYKDELAGIDPQPTMVSSEDLLSDGNLNLPSQAKPDSVPVAEFWIKPGGHPSFPDGAFVTIVGDVIVEFQPAFPNKSGKFPFAHAYGIPNGTFYRNSTVEDLIPLQEEYNENVSIFRNTRHFFGRPQLIAPKGSVSAAKITNEYGLLIEYTPGLTPPSPFPQAQLPAYISEEQQRILTDIEDLSGQHQVSKGSVPAGVTAATAISFLGERDDAYISTYYKSSEKAVEKIGKLILENAVQYWDIPRLVKVVGKDSIVDIQYLSKIDLRNSTDVRTEVGSNIPQSRAARKAELMDMFINGVITADKYLELAEIGGISKVTENIHIDRKHAQRENVRFRTINVMELQQREMEWQAKLHEITQTVPEQELQMYQQQMPEMFKAPLLIPVNDWDNHDVHIEYHNLFRKSQEYETLEPEVQEQINRHVEAHETKKHEAALKQMFSQIPTDGSVPGIMGTEDMAGNISSEEVSPEQAAINDSEMQMQGLEQGVPENPEQTLE